MVVSDGREEDRLYQVMTDSETLVGDMPLDGILVLEMSDSGSEEDASLAKQDSYTQLVASMQEHSAPRPYVPCVARTNKSHLCICVLHCTVHMESAVGFV